MRLLVVEDEKRIADFLCRGLEGAGYAVDAAWAGAAAIDHIHSTDYDLVILDLMLPDMDGLQVLEKIRNGKVGPPVLILSARGALDDRVKGLEQGADDYLVKPFAFVELLARVRARLRRGQPTPDRLQVADLSVRCIRRKVTRGLRFRLTASYALFFALLLITVAVLFRQRLESVQRQEVQDTLESNWRAMKGYLRIELNRETNKYFASWYYDPDDPDESKIV